MNQTKRGDKVIDSKGKTGIIQGPEDFDGYDYNKPGNKWELVKWSNGKRTWQSKLWIRHD